MNSHGRMNEKRAFTLFYTFFSNLNAKHKNVASAFEASFLNIKNQSEKIAEVRKFIHVPVGCYVIKRETKNVIMVK